MKRTLMMVALLAGSTTIDAQVAEPIGVQQGTRMRVAAAGRPAVIGSFVSASADSLRIADEHGRVRSLSVTDVGFVDVSIGSPVRRGRVAKGTLAGALVLGGIAALSGSGGNATGTGDALFAAAILAPVGGLIGGGWAALTAPEQWQTVSVASITSGARVAQQPVKTIEPAKGSGKRIGIGALLGGAAGAAFVQTQRSSSPKVGQYLVAVVPGMLIGGAIGAIWH